MKTVSVITENFALKEKLFFDLATLGYRISSSSVGNSEILIVDYANLKTLGEADSGKVVLVLLDIGEDWDNVILSKVDDVLVTPYDTAELELRLELALVKRGKFESGLAENVLVVDGMTIDVDSYEVTIDGVPLDLTFKEYELLKCLITGRGRVYTRDQLLNIIWGYDYYGGTRTVDVHIRRLRAKLGHHESFIETVRNVGYRFKK